MRRQTTMLLFGVLLTAALAMAQPSIRADNGVLNASSYRPDIARGSWLVIFGSNLGPASISIYSGSLPFPTALSGTSVSVTPAAGGSATPCRIYYTSAGQVAALLPSTVQAGDYDLRVTYNGQPSAPHRIKVVERHFGFATATGNGAGVPQATNASLNSGISLVRFTTGSVSFGGNTWQYRPAYPGETLILWGTGLGADPQSDETGGSSGHQAAANVRVLVGGVEHPAAFAGRSSGSPGLDQINFTLAANVPLGCTTTIQVVAGGRYSNLGILPTAAPGSSACSHPYLTQSQLQTLDSPGGNVIIGYLSLYKNTSSLSFQGLTFDSTTETAGGAFSRYTADLLNSVGGVSVAQIGSCYVATQRGTQTDIQQGVTIRAADAGAQLVLNGPNASNKAIPRIAPENSYSVTLYSTGIGGFGGQGSPTLAGGTYTISGSGGTEIGSFSAQSPFPNAFEWTNRGSISNVTRNQDLRITWSGGGTEPGAVVSISGMSGTQVGGSQTNPIYEVGLFVCTAPASAGSFTVPGGVTGYLNPVAAGSTTNIGFLTVAAQNQTAFSAPIVAGGTAPGEFAYIHSYSKNISVQ